MSEVWKDIQGFEGCYQISSLGRVKSLERKVPSVSGYRTVNERILKNQNNSNGYQIVMLGFKSKTHYVHRLVANAFIQNTKNQNLVNHIDGNKTNNNASNLEWCNHKENSAHAIKIGLCNSIIGANNHKTKLTDKEVLEIREKYIPFKNTQKMLGKEYGVSHFVIRDIINRISWKHV